MSKEDYEKGKQLLNEKNFKKAIESFQKCYMGKFNELRALLYMIDCYLELNNNTKGKELIDKVRELDQNNSIVYYYSGKYWLNLKEYDKAYKDFNAYIENNRLSDHQSIIVYEILHDIKMKQSVYNTALGHIQYAGCFETNTKSIKRKIKEFKAMNKLNKYENIIAQLEFLSIEKETIDIKEQIMLEKAIALSSYDNDENNTSKFTECIQICNESIPHNQKFYYPLACCLYKLKKYSKASEAIDKFILIEPDSSDAYLFQGLIYHKLKQQKSAYVSFQQAVKHDSKCYHAYLEMVKLLLSIQKFKEALGEMKDCIPTQEETQMALKFLLKKAEVYYILDMKKEGNLLMDQIGEFLRDNNIESKINMKSLEEALSSYFILFHLKGGYSVNDFDIGTEELGKGGYGLVTKGKLNNIDVAVKEYIIKEEKPKAKITLLINCIDEMKSMEDLSANTNILHLVTMFYLNEKIYILTEYCDGGNLSKLIHDTSIEFPFQRRVEILLQVAEGLKYLHSFPRPFIHYDIKPLNILLVKKYNQNGYNKIKICDFGLCKTSFVFNPQGTPAYIAPELLLTRSHSSKVDVYSFGITMWEVFTRTQPYKDINFNDITSRVITKHRPDTNRYDHTATTEIKQLISECFSQEESSRPTMEQIVIRLKKMI